MLSHKGTRRPATTPYTDAGAKAAAQRGRGYLPATPSSHAPATLQPRPPARDRVQGEPLIGFAVSHGRAGRRASRRGECAAASRFSAASWVVRNPGVCAGPAEGAHVPRAEPSGLGWECGLLSQVRAQPPGPGLQRAADRGDVGRAWSRTRSQASDLCGERRGRRC